MEAGVGEAFASVIYLCFILRVLLPTPLLVSLPLSFSGGKSEGFQRLPLPSRVVAVNAFVFSVGISGPCDIY